jgi:predicted porin
MKKSLLALAVTGAFAGAAAAQTAVTMYGIADAGIGMSDTGATGASGVGAVFSGVQSTSRWGVRGTEDLTGGLKAAFNLEAGVNYDTGAADATFFQRRTVVGLMGGFGSVMLGRDYTPGFTSAGTTDVMGYGLLGNWLTYTTAGGRAGVATAGIATRASNGLHYMGTFGGITARAMIAFGESDGQNGIKNAGDTIGLSAVYVGGPLTVQGYYHTIKRGVAATVSTVNDTQSGLGAQYRAGAFRVAFNYGSADIDGVGKHNGYGIGGGVKVGAGEVLLNYISQEIKLDAGGPKPTGTSIGVAYVHPLSKRTNLYATYGQTDNKDGAPFAINYSQSSVGASGAAGANADPSAFAVGVRHLF